MCTGDIFCKMWVRLPVPTPYEAIVMASSKNNARDKVTGPVAYHGNHQKKVWDRNRGMITLHFGRWKMILSKYSTMNQSIRFQPPG